MTIDLGSVSFEQNILFKQFRNDLKDDWFPDPLGFRDMVDGGLVEQIINRNFELNNGLYVPCGGEIYNVPKPNHTLRYGIEGGLADRVLYHGLASKLLPYYDPLLPWFVFSHRAATQQTDRYLFRRGIPAWKDFIGSVKNALKPGTFLLSTDCSNYFEHINVIKLRKTFIDLLPRVNATPQEKSAIRASIQFLFDCLKYWTFDGQRGLPQNRDASSFLANVYMHPVDSAMVAHGYTYFRYMDDIKIICDDEFEARRALKRLIMALRDIGASVNSKKTILCAAEDRDSVANCLDTGSADVERLGALWSTRKEKIIRRTFPELQELTLRLLNSGKSDSREFRFFITRLSLLAACKEFAVPPAFFEPVTTKVIEKLPINPAATDQFANYLQSAPVTNDQFARIVDHLGNPKQSFYGWQNYRLWTLLGRKGYKAPAALDQATTIVTAADDTPTRAGATIYAGAVGNEDSRNAIAERFPSLDSFLGQRSAIVATHELPFKGYVKTHIKPHIRPDLTNVYRRMQDNRGAYFSPPEEISITAIIDRERDYD